MGFGCAPRRERIQPTSPVVELTDARAVAGLVPGLAAHATILHMLGLDHEKLTFYHNGIQRRLTDVHRHVLEGLLA